MQVEVLEALVDWVNENILDDTILSDLETASEDSVQDEVEEASSELHESAQLYTWCPHRKRLVRSD